MNDSARGGFRGRGLGALGYLALGLSATAAFLGSLCLGSVSLTFPEVLKALGAKFFGLQGVDPISMAIVWQLRLARSLLAAVAGAALSASGAVLQGLFRNPLADPYSMGVSAGGLPGGGRRKLATPAGGGRQGALPPLWPQLPEATRREVGPLLARLLARLVLPETGGAGDDRSNA